MGMTTTTRRAAVRGGGGGEAMTATTTTPLVRLEELKFDNSFVKRLPGEEVGSLDEEDEAEYYYRHVATRPRQVFGAFYSLVRPTPATKRKRNLDEDDPQENEKDAGPSSTSDDSGMPKLLAWSSSVATQLLNLHPDERTRADVPWILSGNTVLQVGSTTPTTTNDDVPVAYAQCYGGHQFGTWAGQLGDGRAITIMEILNQHGARYELQLKGAGMTPYSRRADGRAVLRSSIREYVCSEYMHALGVPTTRALSLCLTGAGVIRDMFYNGDNREEPGAVVCRVAPSFVRFGTFQLPASRAASGTGSDAKKEKNNALVHALLSYMLEYHYPEAGGVLEMLRELSRRTAVMIAKWQLCGFVHGVMNTDNMSFIGVTIDYGPFAFLDKYEPFFTPNITDLHNRRYCFQNQPAIGLWNIARLLDALIAADAIREDECEDVIDDYRRTIKEAYMEGMSQKLGFRIVVAENGDIDGDAHTGIETDTISALNERMQKLMHRTRADFSLTHRCLSDVEPGRDGDNTSSDLDALRSRGAFASASGDMDDDAADTWRTWLTDYKDASLKNLELLVANGAVASIEEAARLRKQSMNATNPLYVPRNYILQECIEDAEEGNFSKLDELVRVLEDPFTEREANDVRTSSFDHDLSSPPPASVAGKPGVSLLS